MDGVENFFPWVWFINPFETHNLFSGIPSEAQGLTA